MNWSTIDWTTLERDVAGGVIRPGAPDYDTARRPAIARFRGTRPAAIVRCRAPADVAATLAFARRTGLPVAARSGGHCFAGESSTDGIVIDVAPMASVTLAGGVATIGAGARLGAIYDALDAYGVTIPAGCGPRVGIAGLVLGGGLGLLGRAHGLTSDSLTGAEVVLADGTATACDEEREPDLFWALRGAGAAGFGVVTALRFATVPAPDATRLQAVWRAEAATVVIDAWQRWAVDGPAGLAASLLVAAPADPAAPVTATVGGAFLGGEVEAARLLGDLAAASGAAPVSQELAHASYRATKRDLAGTADDDPLEHAHVESRSAFFARPLPAAAIAELVEHLAAGRRPGEARELDLTPMGGAYTCVPAGATAFVHRDARVLLKHAVVTGLDATAGDRAAATAWLERSSALVEEHGTGRAYQNFAEPGRADWARAYYGANLEPLAAIRERYDPDDVLRSAQAIPVRARAERPIG
jgi:FAD/FMN-containing dehydrogenase